MLLVGRSEWDAPFLYTYCENSGGTSYPHAEEAMVGAVFIDCYGAMVADGKQDIGAGGDGEVGAAAIELHVDEHTLAILEGAVARATRVDSQAAVLEERYLGEVVAAIAIEGVGFENHHLLTTADERGLRVDKLSNDIATLRADVKDSLHSNKELVLPYRLQNLSRKGER